MDVSERSLRAISSLLLSSCFLLFISTSVRTPLVGFVHTMLRRYASGFWSAFDRQRAEIFVYSRFAFTLKIVNAPEVYVRPGKDCRIRRILRVGCSSRGRRWRGNQLREKLLGAICVSRHHRSDCESVLRFRQAGILRENTLERGRGGFRILSGELAIALRQQTIQLRCRGGGFAFLLRRRRRNLRQKRHGLQTLLLRQHVDGRNQFGKIIRH